MKVNYLPGVVQAEYVKDFVLDIRFSDGTQKCVDVSQWFKGPVFEPLRKKAYFKKFFVEGATVGWPNGVDISPEALYAAEPAPESGAKSSKGPSRRIDRR